MPESLSMTVVIPTYDRPSWLRRAIRSLGRQTSPPEQVLAVARSTDTPTLDVLDVVDAMQTRRTPHFIIKYDAGDARLIPYLAPHLEKVYDELQQQFGYAPAAPTLVEVFSESQGQSGQGKRSSATSVWFHRPQTHT